MKCIFCGRGHCLESGDRNWYCRSCKTEFDPEDDGDYSDRSPAARIEREERRKETNLKFRKSKA